LGWFDPNDYEDVIPLRGYYGYTTELMPVSLEVYIIGLPFEY